MKFFASAITAIALSLSSHSVAFAAADEDVLTPCKVKVAKADLGKPSRLPETVAFLKRVDGDVRVLRPQRSGGIDEIDGVVGMDLFAFDAVVSGGNGGFDAIFTDNSIVSGVADTCIEISKYTYQPERKKGEFRMRLARGVVSVAAGDVAKLKGDTMSVRVRNDTNLAVTGTRLVVRAR